MEQKRFDKKNKEIEPKKGDISTTTQKAPRKRRRNQKKSKFSRSSTQNYDKTDVYRGPSPTSAGSAASGSSGGETPILI